MPENKIRTAGALCMAVLLGTCVKAQVPNFQTNLSRCADEGGICPTGGLRVYYGANGTFAVKDSGGPSIECSNDAFGRDPVPNVKKSCFVQLPPPLPGSCAPEGGSCVFPGSRALVLYGANGIFAARSLANSASCNNDVFGDPVPNVAKACFIGPTVDQAGNIVATTCAAEGNTCQSGGPRLIYYGAKGTYKVRLEGAGLVHCNSDTFGDPVPNVKKACFVSPNLPLTAACAEGGTCNFPGQSRFIVYGANGTFAARSFANSAGCNNHTFGVDPVPNVVKNCSQLAPLVIH